ncbi:MAG: hypothetical protein M1817_002906 [Caeruleum heppii]|nr:MAG: hypothetical protein M1817_002906 [Caeruleum heppii]
MSGTSTQQPEVREADEDEPDDWDKRIFSTGCSLENTKMNDCYFDKKDWRLCKKELEHVQHHLNIYPPPSGSSPDRMASTIGKGHLRWVSASSLRSRAITDSTTLLSSFHHRRRFGFLTTRPSSALPPSTPRPIPHSLCHRRYVSLKSSPHLRADQQPAPSPSPSSPSPATQSPPPSLHDLSSGLSDEPDIADGINNTGNHVDWGRSFHGLSAEAFSKEAADVLLEPLSPEDVEVKPDGILYLPEIKYRRILNKAFGPGAWGLAPRGETIVTNKSVTREYALVVHGRLVSIARGEQDYFSPEGVPTASEGCKSNALVRCCKDLGVASELWDPRYIRKFMAKNAKEVFVEHVPSKRRKKIWLRRDDDVRYPYKET